MTISLAWPLLQPDGGTYLYRDLVDHRKSLLLCGFVAVYPDRSRDCEDHKVFFAFCFDMV